MNLADKTVLITGANRGIGRALVDEALKRGVRRVYAGTRGGFDVTDPRVTPVALDVSNTPEIHLVAAEVSVLDILVNNAGIFVPDDLSRLDMLEHHLDVNLFGVLRVTQAFLPHLKRSRGSIVNNVSLAALAPVPIAPAYSISKAGALNVTQALRALLRGHGVSVHAAILGPIDTEMTRELNIPKAPAASAAAGIFDGLQKGEEDIFPDPGSQSIADAWRNGASKVLEGQFAAFVPPVRRSS